ncbi:hypothetical protein JCM8202v2_004475 [Rhodotorula sphaerocarpa]
MPPKARSSTTKSATKASLGFASTKKGVTPASKQQAVKAVKSESPASTKSKTALSGLYPRLYKEALRKMGNPIHRDEMDDIEIILRVFDADEEFGPCSRMTRLERWERAEKLGLQPDPELREILQSEEGKTTRSYRDSVFQE